MKEGGLFNPETLDKEDWVLFFDALQARQIKVTYGEAGFLVTPGSLASVQASRKERTQAQLELQDRIVETLREKGALQIGPLCAALVSPGDNPKEIRQHVLTACRALRDDGRLLSTNPTGSNFHVKWALPPSTSEEATPIEPVQTGGLEVDQTPTEEPTLDQVVTSLLESELPTLEGVDVAE